MISRSICPSMKFKLEGVVVRHADPAQTVRVRRLPIDPSLLTRGNPTFTPFRLVINLKVDDPNQPGPVYHLNNEMEVRVEFTANDERDAATAGGQLKLGYWDGKNWFAYGAAHKFQTEPPILQGTGGVGIVMVSDWEDPTKAWGT